LIRILIVDDHVMFREGLKQILAKHSDMRVVDEPGSGQEAMERILRHKFGCFLLDISLPGRSGPELLSEIKKINLIWPYWSLVCIQKISMLFE
jgi:DNA-binding NarL/FixJ family response regulator